MKRKITQQQMDNLIEARDVMWPSVPAANVARGLQTWRADHKAGDAPTCGTVACFGGWCAWWPSFQAQGVSADNDGAPLVEFAEVSSFNVAEVLFGDRELFMFRRYHEADEDFTGTDHELVTNRLNWAIANSEVA